MDMSFYIKNNLININFRVYVLQKLLFLFSKCFTEPRLKYMYIIVKYDIYFFALEEQLRGHEVQHHR